MKPNRAGRQTAKKAASVQSANTLKKASGENPKECRKNRQESCWDSVRWLKSLKAALEEVVKKIQASSIDDPENKIAEALCLTIIHRFTRRIDDRLAAARRGRGGE